MGIFGGDDVPEYKAPQLTDAEKSAAGIYKAGSNLSQSQLAGMAMQGADTAGKGVIQQADQQNRDATSMGMTMDHGMSEAMQRRMSAVMGNSLDQNRTQSVQNAAVQRFQRLQGGNQQAMVEQKIAYQQYSNYYQSYVAKIAARNRVIGSLLSAAGTVIGAVAGGPLGAMAGAAAGKLIGGAVAPTDTPGTATIGNGAGNEMMDPTGKYGSPAE